MADIVLINPRFEISYWGLEHAMPFLGAKAVLPVASLPLLAALTPSGHSVTLIDENVEAIDFARCARADIVGLTGMNVQRPKSIASTFSSIRVTLWPDGVSAASSGRLATGKTALAPRNGIACSRPQ